MATIIASIQSKVNFKSAVSGQFVSESYAAQHSATTYRSKSHLIGLRGLMVGLGYPGLQALLEKKEGKKRVLLRIKKG